ncbi:hypothetical protein FA13DRAFT_1092191 [Coprinellus micaceus]|uniref:F-box domain-containing protein n=1 Tax=Coprinellus micaceus TaxID=71717 RepID=A0A4Y7TS35_COPMI|nr:hypothetical protein FA13DRAFT_1092191 [Coprinellus micaceus]
MSAPSTIPPSQPTSLILPRELTSDIIELAILSVNPYLDLFNDALGIQRTKLRLVCRGWNEVILDNPRLWTHIFLCLDDRYNDEAPKGTLAEATTWISRSRSKKRTLCLIHPGGIEPLSEEEEEEDDFEMDYDATSIDHYVLRQGVAKFIAGNRDWETVYVDFDDHISVVPDIFDCPPRVLHHPHWASLRTLNLKNSADAKAPPEESEIPCGRIRMPSSSCPALREVSLNLTECTLLGWDLPWAQLTSLRLENFINGFKDYLFILHQCPALEIAYLGFGEACYTFGDQLSQSVNLPCPLTLPTIRSLVVDMRVVHPDITAEFFNKLDLPALESLRYYVTCESPFLWSSKDLLDSLRQLILQSNCTLVDLTVDVNLSPDSRDGPPSAPLVNEDALALLLKAAPSVRTLSIQGHALSCSFLLDPHIPLSHIDSMTIINYNTTFDPEVAATFAAWAQGWIRRLTTFDGPPLEPIQEERMVREYQRRISALYMVKPPYHYTEPSTVPAVPPLDERHSRSEFVGFNIRFGYKVVSPAREGWGEGS